MLASMLLPENFCDEPFVHKFNDQTDNSIQLAILLPGEQAESIHHGCQVWGGPECGSSGGGAMM